MSFDGAEAWGPTYTERNSVEDRISFESGYHETTADAAKKIDEGKLDADVWNNEVGDRISNNVLALDSVFPLYEDSLVHISNGQSPDEFDYSVKDKKDVLAWLPIKDREVLVVCGDISYSMQASEFTRSVPNQERKSQLAAIGTAKTQEEISNFLPKLATEYSVTGAAGFLTSTLLFALKNLDNSESQMPAQARKGMSRRKFLKLASAVAGAGTIAYVGGRAAANTLMPLSPNEEIHDIAEKIVELTPQIKLFDQHWLEGRTALLIEKCDAALNQGLTPPNAKGSVVMGNAHALESAHLLESHEARKKAIHSLASDMVAFYDKVLDGFPEVDKSWAINLMLNHMTQTDLVSVTPPESYEVDKNSVNQEVNKNVRYLLSFTAPEVRKAISDLYRIQEDSDDVKELVKQQTIETPAPTAPTPIETPTPKPRPVITPKAP